MILYLDASAYVKHYVLETGHDEVAHLIHESEAVACHELGQVEVASALERACRERRLTATQLRYLIPRYCRSARLKRSFTASRNASGATTSASGPNFSMSRISSVGSP